MTTLEIAALTSPAERSFLPHPEEWHEALDQGRASLLKACLRRLNGPLPPQAWLEHATAPWRPPVPLVLALLSREDTALEELRGTPEEDGVEPVRATVVQCRTLLDLALKAGADPNLANERGQTPLMVACGMGSLKSVRLLLAAGADPHAVSAYRATAVHQAVLSGCRPVLQAILDAGANPNVQDQEGYAPLHLVAKEMASTDVLKSRLFLKTLHGAGADWTLKDNRDRTPADLIAYTDPNMANWWRHRPAKDSLMNALPHPLPSNTMAVRKPRM